MVKDGRLRGYRLGPHWYVRKSDLEAFAQIYHRPKNAPRHRSAPTAFYSTNELLRWLLAWDSASSRELAQVVDIHVGNVRKYLRLSADDGLVVVDDSGQWRLTETGRTRAIQLPPIDEAAAAS